MATLSVFTDNNLNGQGFGYLDRDAKARIALPLRFTPAVCFAVLAGVISIGWGVDVNYSGLESSFQQIASPAFNVAIAAFAIGVLVASRSVRAQDPVAR